MKPLFSLLLLLTNTNAFSLDSTNGLFRIIGYAAASNQYDINTPAGNDRPDFIYSHNRHNKINLNLAFMKINYSGSKVLASLALATGTANGFKTWAYSINYDYLITYNSVWCVEDGRLSAKDKTVEKEGMPVKSNFSLTTSLVNSF